MANRTLWIDFVLSVTDIVTGGQFAVDLTTDFTSEQTRLSQLTLLRTVVGLDLAYTVHDSGEGSQTVGLGLGIESQEAFAAGTHPDPLIRGDFPTRGWIYRGVWRVFGFAAGSADVSVRRVELDLRSRRKLENGLSFLVVDNTANEGATGTVRLTGLVRQLWMLT